MPGSNPASSDDVDRLIAAVDRHTMMVGLTEVLNHLGTNHNNHDTIMALVRELYEDCQARNAGVAELPPKT